MIIQQTTLRDFQAAVNKEAAADASVLDFYFAKFFQIEFVELFVVWPTREDGETPEPSRLFSDNSGQVLDLLNRANSERGTIITFKIENKAIPHRCLANANVFSHNRGFADGKYTFRAWRRHEVRTGYELGRVWRTIAGWQSYKEKIGLAKPMSLKQSTRN